MSKILVHPGGGTKNEWDQWPNETESAYMYFLDWMYSGIPGIKEWAVSKDMHPTKAYSLSARHRWRPRALAYQNFLTCTRMEAAAQEAAEMGRKHARAWGATFEMAAEAIHKAYAHGHDLDAVEAVRLLKIATDQQRLMMGEASAKVDINVKGVDLEKLDALDSALKALAGGESD